MTSFITLGYLAAIFTTTALGALLLLRRHMILKPSFFVLLLFNVKIQWAAALYADEIYAFLPRHWHFFALAHGFPILGMIGSVLSADKTAAVLWDRIRQLRTSDYRRLGTPAVTLLGAAAALALMYVAVVPLSSTGLYAIFFAPQEAAEAREESLKLLPGHLQYAHLILAKGVGPLAAAVLAFWSVAMLHTRRKLRAMAGFAAVGFVLLSVSLSGARSLPAGVILVLVFGFLLHKGFPLRLRYIAGGLIVILSIPILLSLMRSNKDVTLTSYLRMMQSSISRRLLYTPMETGLNHAHYAQTQGYFGAAGDPRLARLANVQPVQVSNVIALRYKNTRIRSALSNTSYVFAYYSFFGLESVLIAIPLLWLIDLSLLPLLWLRSELIAPVVSALVTRAMALTSSVYTSLFVTHGLFIVLGSAVAIELFCRVTQQKVLSSRQPRYITPNHTRL